MDDDVEDTMDEDSTYGYDDAGDSEEEQDDELGFAVADDAFATGDATTDRSKSYQVEYKSHTVASIEASQQKEVEHVASMFMIKDTDAAILLRHFGWNKERLIERYMDSPDKVNLEAGVLEDPSRPKLQMLPEFTCESALWVRTTCPTERWRPWHSHVATDSVATAISSTWSKRSEVKASRDVYSACVRSATSSSTSALLALSSRPKPLIATRSCSTVPMSTTAVSCVGVLPRTANSPSSVTSPTRCSTRSYPRWPATVATLFALVAEMQHMPLPSALSPSCGSRSAKTIARPPTGSRQTPRNAPSAHRPSKRNGGCNHMTCRKCKYEWCWICAGPWSEHGNSWYNCNRYDEKSGSEARDTQAKSRAQLERYLHYFNRYANHEQSAKLDRDLYGRTEKKMEEMQVSSGLTWIEVQFLKKAVDTLTECRMTLKWTYCMAYYLARDNMTELFEDNQRDLEKAVEDLSEQLEKPIEPKLIPSCVKR